MRIGWIEIPPHLQLLHEYNFILGSVANLYMFGRVFNPEGGGTSETYIAYVVDMPEGADMEQLQSNMLMMAEARYSNGTPAT